MQRTFAAAAVATLLLAACSTSSSSTGSAAPSGGTGTTTTVQLTEFQIIMPASLSAGVQTLHIENIGGMPHFIDFMSVQGAKTDDDITAFLNDPQSANGPPPSWLTPASIPSISLYSAGTSSDITMNLPPGRYAAFCFMPDAEGKPHAVDGMHTVFDVTGQASDEALPTPELTVTWNGTALEGAPTSLPAGTHTIGFANTGTKPAQLAMIQLLEDAPVDQIQKDVNAWFNSLYAGAPPVAFLGGISAVPPGGDLAAVTTVNLTDGQYAFGGPGKSAPAEFTVGAGGVPSPSASASAASCTPSGTDLSVTVSNISFGTDCLAAPAGQAFTIAFDNQDASVPHNLAIYPEGDGTKALFTGDVVTGVASATYDVPALQAGTYRFQCDVHPTTMSGTFVVS
jgi:plastocyanin